MMLMPRMGAHKKRIGIQIAYNRMSFSRHDRFIREEKVQFALGYIGDLEHGIRQTRKVKFVLIGLRAEGMGKDDAGKTGDLNVFFCFHTVIIADDLNFVKIGLKISIAKTTKKVYHKEQKGVDLTMMTYTDHLKTEMSTPPAGSCAGHYYRYLGYRKDLTAPNLQARANGIEALFTETLPYVYRHDLIVGSIRPMWCEKSAEELQYAASIVNSFGDRSFGTNSDHFSPDYRRIVNGGIPGLLSEIDRSAQTHAAEPERLDYLAAMKQTVLAFRTMILRYADAAGARAADEEDAAIVERLRFAERNCRTVADHAPSSFAEGLQLVWLCHTAFNYEGRYAMALGRIDQYLYPLYEKDLAAETLTHARAVELLENAFMKIYEKHAFFGGDDVVNICIGGTAPDGTSDVNDLSYCVLEAVRNCNVPGPNLSARISSETPDAFLDACLKVIGTGLGYPALMNDEVNMAALRAVGYDPADVCDYTMVGCIENFMTGLQPPWSDGRFDTPRFFEYLFNGGRGILHPSVGIDTGDVEDIPSMEEFMRRFERQLAYGVSEYCLFFRNENDRINPKNYRQPFLSCFCRDCIGRALDMGEGGCVYPSVHGAALMGVGTVTDSLAAIEQVVFVDQAATLREIGDALRANFEGYEALREKLQAAPKYGNNNEFVDKYAVWFVNYLAGQFRNFRTRDGGAFYVAMAANTSNIWAGKILAATPDGRLAGEPLSDAASPTYGKDTRGATATINSVTKPDYTQVACGTVINQKFSPSMFEGDKRKKLLTLIKTYIKKGGQEMQINATSREVLADAMEHPENYPNLVVRVSGFSALYVTLARDVQLDILNRTQQG